MDNYNVYSKLDYSKRLQSQQAKKNLIFKINNNPAKPAVIAQLCNNSVYIYPLTNTIKHYTNKRCNLAPLIETIKNLSRISGSTF